MESTFIQLANNPIRFKAFLLFKLPAAFISGLRIEHLEEGKAAVSIPFKWLTQNPFRSIYFASLAMAAELSTGVLAMNAVWGKKPVVSMLVSDMSAQFIKKATGRIVFSCEDGQKILQAVDEAIRTGDGQKAVVKSEGKDKSGKTVAVFEFSWSFKQRAR